MASSSLPKANGTKPVLPVLRNRNKRSMDYDPKESSREFKRRDTQLLGAKGLQRVRFVLLNEHGQQTKRIHIFKLLSDTNGNTAEDDEVKFDFSRFKFQRMLDVIGVEEETAREMQYSALLPCGHVIDVSNRKGWRRAIIDLDRWMSRLFVAEEAEPVVLGPGRFVVREDTPEPAEEVKDGAMVNLQIPPSAFPAMLQSGAAGLQDLDPWEWSRACELFCHPPDDERGVKLPGVGVRIPPKLMCDMHEALRTCGGSESSFRPLKMGVAAQLCLFAIRSLCRTVSDICSATHAGLSDAEIDAFEQDYHIQCHCRSTALRLFLLYAPHRGLRAVAASSTEEMEGIVQIIEKLFNDKLIDMFKHCMFPMIFKDGKLTNIFPDYGVDPLNIIVQQRSAKDSGAQDGGAGGLERVIILGTEDMNHPKLWRAAFQDEPAPLDLNGRYSWHSELISDLITVTERAQGLHRKVNAEGKATEGLCLQLTKTEKAVKAVVTNGDRCKAV